MSTSSSSAESPHSSFAATTSISASAPGDPQRAGRAPLPSCRRLARRRRGDGPRVPRQAGRMALFPAPPAKRGAQRGRSDVDAALLSRESRRAGRALCTARRTSTARCASLASCGADAACGVEPCSWVRGVSRGSAPARLLVSERSCPGGAAEAAALVLATQDFVANGGWRPSCRRRRSAASPGRTGSRGRVGRRGWLRSEAAPLESPTSSIETTACSPLRHAGIRRSGWCLPL